MTSRPRPHLHLDVGVGEGVLGRQLPVVVDQVIEEGGAKDGLGEGQGGGGVTATPAVGGDGRGLTHPGVGRLLIRG